jgi:hypothetical protein
MPETGALNMPVWHSLLLPSTETKAGKQAIGLPSHLAIRSSWAIRLSISNDYFKASWLLLIVLNIWRD